MTDRFKFRVWDRLYKTYSIVQYGNYALSDDGELFWLLSNCDCSELNTEKYIVEQCTGLKDKNGKLIYENDVVKDTIIESGVIKWNEYHACFMVVFNDGDNREFGELDTKNFEVIGNIHTDEELLK